MNADVAKLFTAISSVGNIDDIVLVANPSQATALALQPRSGELRVWSTRALAAGTVVAVDVNGFISAMSPLPRIEATGQAIAHFDDSSPLPIGTPGAPPTVAAPVRSAYQTDTVLVKMVLSASWAVRPGAVAFISSTTW
jgi:hypothetical protein